MEKNPKAVKDKGLQAFVRKAMLNWFFCAVLLASSPLFLKITFELVSKTNWKIIAKSYCSECILAACALAASIYAIDVDDTNKTVFRTLIRNLSFLSIVFSIGLYFAFYYGLPVGQQNPDNWVGNQIYTYFFISILIYCWHVFAGLFITFVDSKNTYQLHLLLKLAHISIPANIGKTDLSEGVKH